MTDATGDVPMAEVHQSRAGGISGRQAFLAIALVFFLGVVIGIGIGMAR